MDRARRMVWDLVQLCCFFRVEKARVGAAAEGEDGYLVGLEEITARATGSLVQPEVSQARAGRVLSGCRLGEMRWCGRNRVDRERVRCVRGERERERSERYESLQRGSRTRHVLYVSTRSAKAARDGLCVVKLSAVVPWVGKCSQQGGLG